MHDQEQVPGKVQGKRGQLGALLQGQGLIYPLQSALMMIEPGHFYRIALLGKRRPYLQGDLFVQVHYWGLSGF